jgi:hypothetical protein
MLNFGYGKVYEAESGSRIVLGNKLSVPRLMLRANTSSNLARPVPK